MSSVFSIGQRQKQMRGTDSLITDKRIFCSCCLAQFRGIKEQRCLDTCGVAQGHF
jgi:hypothetical protein